MGAFLFGGRCPSMSSFEGFALCLLARVDVMGRLSSWILSMCFHRCIAQTCIAQTCLRSKGPLCVAGTRARSNVLLKHVAMYCSNMSSFEWFEKRCIAQTCGDVLLEHVSVRRVRVVPKRCIAQTCLRSRGSRCDVLLKHVGARCFDAMHCSNMSNLERFAKRCIAQTCLARACSVRT